MEQFRGTTILSVRKDNSVVIGGDGQVSMGNTVMKGNARKVRRLYKDTVIAGFAGGTADAFTLFERFEAQLEKHQGQLPGRELLGKVGPRRSHVVGAQPRNPAASHLLQTGRLETVRADHHASWKGLRRGLPAGSGGAGHSLI